MIYHPILDPYLYKLFISKIIYFKNPSFSLSLRLEVLLEASEIPLSLSLPAPRLEFSPPLLEEEKARDEGEEEEERRERDGATTEIMQIGLETLQRRVFDAASRITHSPRHGSIIGFPWRILGSL